MAALCLKGHYSLSARQYPAGGKRKQVRALSREARRQPEEFCSLSLSPSMLLGSPPAFRVAPSSAVDSDDANLRITEDKTPRYQVLIDVSVP